jgi:hypothetical protein
MHRSSCRFVRPRPALRASLVLLATSLLATTGAAQQVRGRLLRQADSSAVGDALVLLLDAGRREVGRAATTASGGFQLQGTGTGRYTVRVQRIGFQGWETPPVDLTAETPWSVTLYLPEEPFVLPELTSRATQPSCGLSLSDPALAARLLEAAQTALGLAEAEAAEGRHRYMVQTWRRMLRPDGTPADTVLALAPKGMSGWPVQSAEPESLRVWGFVRGTWPPPREVQPGPGIGPVYYGPDARVLFTAWFLEGHCFAVARAKGGGDSTLVLRFGPRKGARPSGIEGELVLARPQLELRSVSWRFLQRPHWVPRDAPMGGRMQVARLPDGAWVPARWEMRAPVPAVVPGQGDYTLHGFAEVGGYVVEALGPDGSRDADATAALRRVGGLVVE